MLSDQVSDVAVFINFLIVVPPVGIADLIDVREKVDVARNVSAEYLEAMLYWIELWVIAKMPLSEDACGIPMLG